MSFSGSEGISDMMINRRKSLVALALAGLSVYGTFRIEASLADPAGNAPLPFTQEAFDAAQKAGKPILIDTYATWCDVCARQAPVLDKLRADPKYRDLITFKVNFDTQKDVMRKFNARMQSTLICYRGTKEVGRSVGETQGEWIDDMLQKTLQQGSS